MRGIEIMLSSIEDVKHFVQTITMFDGEFELVSGKYIVDAKYIENLRCCDYICYGKRRCGRNIKLLE